MAEPCSSLRARSPTATAATGVLQMTDSSGGFGITLLSGTNTYTGGTKVVGATLQGSNDHAVGTGLVTLENGLFMAADKRAGGKSHILPTISPSTTPPRASAIDVNGYSLTIAGKHCRWQRPWQTDGAGQLWRRAFWCCSAPTPIAAAPSSVSCAALQLGDATHTASIVGAVTNEGFFDIVKANTSGITSITTDGGLHDFLRQQYRRLDDTHEQERRNSRVP